MKQYFRNLLQILQGKNPYQAERDDLEEKLRLAGENVRGLNNLYYKALEKWENERKKVASLLQLVENLRERISDKDAIIEKQWREYDKFFIEEKSKMK